MCLRATQILIFKLIPKDVKGFASKRYKIMQKILYNDSKMWKKIYTGKLNLVWKKGFLKFEMNVVWSTLDLSPCVMGQNDLKCYIVKNWC